MWSWNLLAEKIHAQVSAASTSNNILLPETTVQLRAGVAEQEKEKEEEETSEDDLRWTELLLKDSGEKLRGQETQEETRQKKAPRGNLWEFCDLAALPDEMPEKPEEKNCPEKRKAFVEEFINWLDDKIHEHCRTKISKTYWREQQEGDEVYKCKNINNV